MSFILGTYVTGATEVFTEDTFTRVQNLKTRPDDVFLVTYPRTGTTWTQNIMLALRHGSNFLSTVTDAKALAPHFPFMEYKSVFFDEPIDVRVEKMESPRFMKIHLPVQTASKNIFTEKLKCVFVFRNPKDCCVSFESFSRQADGLKRGHPGTFDGFVSNFLEGTVNYGCYWKWCADWLNFAKENPDTSLVLFYEDMLEDFEGNITKLANFLGYPISPEIIEDVKKVTSFEQMKRRLHMGMNDFMRQGTSKSYEAKLSKEVIDAFDAKSREVFADSEYLDKFLF